MKNIEDHLAAEEQLKKRIEEQLQKRADLLAQ